MAKRVKTIDFEISFYEGVVQHSPDFVEALINLGDLYTKRGDYEKGLQVDERLYQLAPQDPVVLYNLACSYSLLNQIDKAYRTVKKAVHCGYNDIKFLESDQDLNNLRQDDRFKRFLERMKKDQIQVS